MDQIWRKKQIEGLLWKVWRSGVEIEEDREKKGKSKEKPTSTKSKEIKLYLLSRATWVETAEFGQTKARIWTLGMKCSFRDFDDRKP